MAEYSIPNYDTRINIALNHYDQLNANITKASSLARWLFESKLVESDEEAPLFGYLWTLVDLVIEIEQLFKKIA